MEEKPSIDELPTREARCETANHHLLAHLRDAFGVQTYIIGFKLVNQQELLKDEGRGSPTKLQPGKTPKLTLKKEALHQVLGTRINLTVVSDVHRLRQAQVGKGTIFLATAEGGFVRLVGSVDKIAQQFVEFLEKRFWVQWFQTERKTVDTLPELPPHYTCAETREEAPRLLRFAIETFLLTSHPGNVSYRYSPPQSLVDSSAPVTFLVTPRKVDKSKLQAADLVHTQVNIPSRRIQCWCAEPFKSSIDSGMQAVLYSRLPLVSGFLHFHYGPSSLVVADFQTSFPYPCGTIEEADDIYNCLSQMIMAGLL
jgi:hypothetical protein